MELLSKVADLALARLFNFLTQKLRYPFKVGDNVRDLESATRCLLAKKENLKAQIEIAERNGQIPTPQVHGWLNEVEATKAQVDDIVEKYNQRHLCFTCFSSDCCSIYGLSRSAAKMLLDVQRLINEEPKEEVAITPVPPPVQEVPMPPTLTSFADTVSNFEEALRCIKEEQVWMIGIWGMGGIGKTHLLKQINNSFIDDSPFDVVIFVTVSQSCTVEKLQSEIAKNQSLKQDGDVATQAKIIFNFLRERIFLLLLDDIWERIDLQKVGIPFPLCVVGGCKSKVVLTTRSADVCRQMEVRKKIHVRSLNYEDAWSLFTEKVGEETINSHPRIPNLAGDLVKELDGLPLAIITIGRAMYEKNNPSEWEYTINLLRKSQLHEVEDSCEEEERTFYRLKFSYDNLKSETLRECFLSCSMWHEDYDIPNVRLIEIWMGLGLIQVFADISETYNTGYALIGHLIGACLLEPSDGFSDRVRMHDVLRDMAIWIACDNGKKKNKWVVSQGDGPFDREIWHEAERISLIIGKILEIPHITTSSTSKLTTLNIQAYRPLKELRNIRACVALTFLDLSYCTFGWFPVELCGLIQLRYLNLSHTDTRLLPEELKFLINLKFLFLSDTGIHTIPPDVIGTLKSLQVLNLYGSRLIDLHGGRNDDIKYTYLQSLVFKELECLKDLRSLGICVESMPQLNKIIQLPNLSVDSVEICRLESTSFPLISSFLWDENIQLRLANLSIVNSNLTQVVIEGNHQHPRWKFQALKSLDISNVSCLEEIIWKGVVPKELFPAVNHIFIEGCDMLKSVSWVLHLPCLEDLWVRDCPSIRQLIACENVADTVEKEEEKEVMLASTFPSLKRIILYVLPEMVSICHSTIAFPVLKHIRVKNCPKLKKLPFQPGNIPSKLRRVTGSKEWWEGLEWEDNSVKTSLQPFFKNLEEFDG